MRHTISGRTRKLLLVEEEFQVLRNLALDTIPGQEDIEQGNFAGFVSLRAQYRQDNPFMYQLDTGQAEDEPVSRDEQVLVLENALRSCAALLAEDLVLEREVIENTLEISEAVSTAYLEASLVEGIEAGDNRILPYRAGYVAGLRQRIAYLTGENKEEE